MLVWLPQYSCVGHLVHWPLFQGQESKAWAQGTVGEAYSEQAEVCTTEVSRQNGQEETFTARR